MAIPISDKDLREMPILYENNAGNIRLVQSDERNFEIIVNRRVGESGRGRKGVVRDCWCSLPSYHSTVSSAFYRLLDMEISEGDRIEVSNFRNSLEEIKKSFLNQISGKVQKMFCQAVHYYILELLNGEIGKKYFNYYSEYLTKYLEWKLMERYYEIYGEKFLFSVFVYRNGNKINISVDMTDKINNEFPRYNYWLILKDEMISQLKEV